MKQNYLELTIYECFFLIIKICVSTESDKPQSVLFNRHGSSRKDFNVRTDERMHGQKTQESKSEGILASRWNSLLVFIVCITADQCSMEIPFLQTQIFRIHYHTNQIYQNSDYCSMTLYVYYANLYINCVNNILLRGNKKCITKQ